MLLKKIGLTTAAVSLFLAGFTSGQAAEQKGPDPGSFDLKTIAFVTNRDSNDVTLIDTRGDTVIGRIPLGEFADAHMAMLTPEGDKLLVSATGRNRFLVVDTASLTVEREIRTGDSPEHFDITPDGRLAYIGNMKDATVSVVDLQSGQELRRIAGFSEPHGVSVLPGGKVYVSDLQTHEVGILHGSGARMAARIPIGNVHRAGLRDPKRYESALKGIAHPTLTVDGRFAYAADGDAGEVGIIDTRTDRLVSTVKVGASPWRAYASPDGRYMVVINNGDQTLSVLDTQTQEVVAVLNGGPEMTGVNFVQGGRKAYVIGRGEGRVYVYDMNTLKKIQTISVGEPGSLETGATTADGEKIYVTSSGNHSVYVIRADSDQVKRIDGVGRFPWGITILGAGSPNYCH